MISLQNVNKYVTEEVKCEACKNFIKGAQYRIENKEGKKIWACSKCWEKVK